MEEYLRAGAAIFHAEFHHAAHDAWEERWLDLEDGTPDERLLHGLIQFTAVVHHGHAGNWTGAQGLAESAFEYLSEVPDETRDVALEPIRSYLSRVATDPEHLERSRPPPVRIEGVAPTFDTLDPDAAFIVAPILADALGHDEDAITAGVQYAREDLERGEGSSRFVALLLDYVRESAHRETIVHRVSSLADRRRTRIEDVEDLF